MLNIGRNEPCPCDSGKKYKKCCLPKFETEARIHKLGYKEKLNTAIDEIPARAAITQVAKQKSLSKYNETLHEVTCFLNSEDVDSEGVFEFFDELYTRASEVEQYDEFFYKVSELKAMYPDLYKKEGKYIISSCIDAKLKLAEADEACQLFIEFCHHCGHDLDVFYPVMNKLLYYGEYRAILQGIKEIWPAVLKTPELFGWAKEELKQKYCKLACLCEYFASNGSITEEAIIKEISHFDFDGADDRERAIHVFQILKSNAAINAKNIQTDRQRLKSDDLLDDVVHEVLDAFLCHLAINKKLNPCKTMAYWQEITNYIIARLNGNLNRDEEDIVHPFCPEEKTLDKYIMRNFMDMFGFHLEAHRAIIFLQAIIHWVEFLFDNGLIKAASSTLKRLSNTYVMLYGTITTENSAEKIKHDGRELLVSLRNKIESYESECLVA